MESEEKRLRMAIISGAAEAIRLKERKPRATEDEILQHITENVERILERIDDPL